MAYTPTSWVNGKTPINATNLNKIENELKELNDDGFLFKALLTSSDDLNNITEAGVYVYYTDSIPANAPYSNGAIVEVVRSNSTSARIIQRCTRYGTGGETQLRTLYESGTWNDWEKYVMQSDLTAFVKYKKFSLDNKTLSAGGYENYTIDVALSGYTPIGTIQLEIESATTNGANSSYCFAYRNYISSNTLNLSLRNTKDSDAVIKINATVLYLKS